MTEPVAYWNIFTQEDIERAWSNPEETIELVKEMIPWKEYLNQFPITKRFI